MNDQLGLDLPWQKQKTNIYKHVDQYMLERRRDSFFLLIVKDQNTGQIDQHVKDEQLTWLSEHKVHFEPATSDSPYDEDLFFVDFDSWEDLRLKMYAGQFECIGGLSLDPERFQMFCIGYKEWAIDKGIK